MLTVLSVAETRAIVVAPPRRNQTEAINCGTSSRKSVQTPARLSALTVEGFKCRPTYFDDQATYKGKTLRTESPVPDKRMTKDTTLTLSRLMARTNPSDCSSVPMVMNAFHSPPSVPATKDTEQRSRGTRAVPPAGIKSTTRKPMSLTKSPMDTSTPNRVAMEARVLVPPTPPALI